MNNNGTNLTIKKAKFLSMEDVKHPYAPGSMYYNMQYIKKFTKRFALAFLGVAYSALFIYAMFKISNRFNNILLNAFRAKAENSCFDTSLVVKHVLSHTKAYSRALLLPEGFLIIKILLPLSKKLLVKISNIYTFINEKMSNYLGKPEPKGDKMHAEFFENGVKGLREVEKATDDVRSIVINILNKNNLSSKMVQDLRTRSEVEKESNIDSIALTPFTGKRMEPDPFTSEIMESYPAKSQVQMPNIFPNDMLEAAHMLEAAQMLASTFLTGQGQAPNIFPNEMLEVAQMLASTFLTEEGQLPNLFTDQMLKSDFFANQGKEPNSHADKMLLQGLFANQKQIAGLFVKPMLKGLFANQKM